MTRRRAPRTARRRAGSALCALRRQAPQGRRPASGARCAPTPIARRARARRERRERATCSAPAAPATCSSPAPGAAQGRYRAVPDRYSPSPGFRAQRGAVGRAPDPGAHGVLLLQLDARPRRRLLSEPGGRDRVAAAARGVAGAASTANPSSRDAGARRRGAAGPRAARRATASSASWCRSTPATSSPASSAGAGGASTAARRRGATSRPSSRACARRSRERPTGGAMSEHRLRGRSTRAPEPYAAVPTLVVPPARRGAGGRDHPLDRAALPDPDRAAAPALLGGRGGAAARAVRRDPALGRHAEAVPLDARRPPWSPGFTGQHRVELPVPCTYDFEVAAAKYLHALDDGEIPLLFLFSGTVFAKGDGGPARDPGAVGPGGALAAAGARLARARWTATSRTAAGSASGATPSTRCCA